MSTERNVRPGCFGSFTLFDITHEMCASCDHKIDCPKVGALNLEDTRRAMEATVARIKEIRTEDVGVKNLGTETLTKDFAEAMSRYESPKHAFEQIKRGAIPKGYEELYVVVRTLCQFDKVSVDLASEYIEGMYPKHSSIHCQRLAIITLAYFHNNKILSLRKGEYSIA